MAIDLFSYSSQPVEDTNSILAEIKSNLPNIFDSAFHISEATAIDGIRVEIALEAGLKDARSLFLVRLVDKSAAGQMEQFVERLRRYFGNTIVVLFENERPI